MGEEEEGTAGREGCGVSEPAYTIRSTLLKAAAKSLAHAKMFIDGGHHEESLSMRIGSGGHALLLGTPEVVVFPGVRRGKAWDAFEAEHAGKCILNEREHAIATGLARAVQVHPDADRLLYSPGTQHEVLVEWLFGGRRWSARIDSLGLQAVSDLKCVQDASPQRFPYQARKMLWHMQAVVYKDGLELAGIGEREPYLIAVESTPPHLVQVYRLTDEDIDLGRKQYEMLFDRVLEAEQTGCWPGYADGILPLNVLGLPMAEDDETEEESDAA